MDEIGVLRGSGRLASLKVGHLWTPESQIGGQGARSGSFYMPQDKRCSDT